MILSIVLENLSGFISNFISAVVLIDSTDPTSCNIGERCVYIYKGPEWFTGTAAFSVMLEPVWTTSPATVVTYHQLPLSSRLPVPSSNSLACPVTVIIRLDQEPRTEDSASSFTVSPRQLSLLNFVSIVFITDELKVQTKWFDGEQNQKTH
jgi:hypothetical protein